MSRLSGWPPCAVWLGIPVLALWGAGAALAAPAPSYDVLIEQVANTPFMQEADALYDAALARVDQADVIPNPSLSIDAENAFGSKPYSGYRNAETSLSLTQPLEIWGQRGARVGAARAEADASGLRRVQVQHSTAGVLALAYAEAEAAARRHELAVEALALTEADSQAVAALVHEGREAGLRAIQAESELQAARASAEEARAYMEASFARLSALAMLPETISSIGNGILDRLPVTGSLEGRDPLSVKIASADTDAARRYVRVEELRARPEVSASVGMRHFEEEEAEAFSFGLTVSIPLFDRNDGAIRAARAEHRAAEARLIAARLETQAEYRAAKANLNSSFSRVEAADSSVQAAEEAYRLGRVGFEAGRISQLELRSFRASLIAARNAAIDARLSRVRAETDLARLEGRIPFREES